MLFRDCIDEDKYYRTDRTTVWTGKELLQFDSETLDLNVEESPTGSICLLGDPIPSWLMISEEEYRRQIEAGPVTLAESDQGTITEYGTENSPCISGDLSCCPLYESLVGRCAHVAFGGHTCEEALIQYFKSKWHTLKTLPTYEGYAICLKGDSLLPEIWHTDQMKFLPALEHSGIRYWKPTDLKEKIPKAGKYIVSVDKSLKPKLVKEPSPGTKYWRSIDLELEKLNEGIHC